MYDFIIIGSGVIGTSIARALSKYEVSILVLEKESDVANHQTIANSAIIHSGHDPEVGSLKAQLCVRGNELYDALQKELDIPLLHTGAYVLAHNNEEEKTLEMLLERGKENGVKALFLLSKEEAFKEEPNLNEHVTQVLSLPTTKVTFPWEVAFAMMENAMENGAKLKLNSEVTDIQHEINHFNVTINHQEIIQSKLIINASGVFSDLVAGLIEKEVPYQIIPRKGEYFVLDRHLKGMIQHVLYPLPTERGKGVLITPQVHGNILVGPTSDVVVDREDLSVSSKQLSYIIKEAKRLAPNIPFHRNIRNFSGIRASSTHKDFYIKESKEVKGFFHVAGIDSPGLTAAPAIAEYVESLITKSYTLKKKANFNPVRQKTKVFRYLSDQEKRELVKKQPLHGHIICKCEHVTEQDVINAIHSPLGHDTIKGIKKRTRAGAGLCQGGYCESLVLKIIARETQQEVTDIQYYAKNTPILLKEAKVK
jgi:glycerol-3-phosphate dehydrogenase